MLWLAHTHCNRAFISKTGSRNCCNLLKSQEPRQKHCQENTWITATQPQDVKMKIMCWGTHACFFQVYLHRTFLRCWPKHVLLNTQLLSALSSLYALASLQHSKFTASSSPSKKSISFKPCVKSKTQMRCQEKKTERIAFNRFVHWIIHPDSNIHKKQQEHMWQATDTFRNHRTRNANCNFWYLWSSQQLFISPPFPLLDQPWKSSLTRGVDITFITQLFSSNSRRDKVKESSSSSSGFFPVKENLHFSSELC